MTALRAVRPRNACEAASAVPAYASTSVIITATVPASARRDSTQPSRSGATSWAGRAKKPRASNAPGAGHDGSGNPGDAEGSDDTGDPSNLGDAEGSGATGDAEGSGDTGTSARRPGGMFIDFLTDPAELLGHPDRCRSAVTLPGGQRARHGQHRAHIRGQVRGHPGEILVTDLREIALVHLAPDHQVPHHLVRLTEWHPAPDKELGKVGGECVAGGSTADHPYRIKSDAANEPGHRWQDE